MADTSKMSPEAYAAFIGRKSYPSGHPTNIRIGKELPKSQGESMSERFAPGQTVWMKDSGFACELIAERSGRAFVLSKKTLVVGLVDLVSLTATDPNAKPQNCPFCGGESKWATYGSVDYLVRCSLDESCLVGPHKPTREEAVAAWNSIRIADPVYQINWPHETVKANPGQWENGKE